MNRRGRVAELVDRGLAHQQAREWDAARDFHRRALDLTRRTKGAPAAWHLGVAATALGDWSLARAAWAAFGIPVAAGVGPIEGDLGPTPVRLAASDEDGEVVWGRRLCPARVRIENVPLPASGRRFGDVVLLAGTPEGTRTFAGQDWPVFDELALLERSPYPTLTTMLTLAGPEDDAAVEDAEARFVDEGLGFECWTPDATGGSVEVGIGADAADAARVLGAWRAGGPGRAFGDLVEA